jgi:hypothetical protein
MGALSMRPPPAHSWPAARLVSDQHMSPWDEHQRDQQRRRRQAHVIRLSNTLASLRGWEKNLVRMLASVDQHLAFLRDEIAKQKRRLLD